MCKKDAVMLKTIWVFMSQQKLMDRDGQTDRQCDSYKVPIQSCRSLKTISKAEILLAHVQFPWERGINLLGRTIPGDIPVKGGIEVSEGRFPIPAGSVEGGGIPRE